jgi:WS/DGAT/MGAT family acyltransferase
VQGGRFALVLKLHHCLSDGLGGVNLLARLLSPGPARVVGGGPARPPARRAPRPGRLVAEACGRHARAPLALARSVRSAARHPRSSLASATRTARGLADSLLPALRPTSRTPLNPGAIGPERRLDWIRFDLERVEQVRQGLGGKLNDVALAVVAGALRRYLAGRGAPIDRLELRAAVPVSTRGEGERSGLGNRVSAVLVPLPVREEEARERLRQVIRSTERVKRSQPVAWGRALGRIGDWTPPSLIGRALRAAARLRVFNLVVTNIPGPCQPLFLLEAPLLECYPLVPLFPNQGLGIALASYAGSLFFGLNAEGDAMPDLAGFVGSLATELDELCKAAREQRAAKAPPQ